MPLIFLGISLHEQLLMIAFLLDSFILGKTKQITNIPSKLLLLFSEAFVYKQWFQHYLLLQRAALAHAEVLLLDKIAMLRLHNVWGVGGGGQPVKALSRRIHMLLEEYLSSNDATEAARCLRELEVPHFHHELVYEVSINMALRISYKSKKAKN